MTKEEAKQGVINKERTTLEKYVAAQLFELGADLAGHKEYSFNRGVNVGMTKAYDEAIRRAKDIYNETAIPSATHKGICTYIFPELKESEDERIRKDIINIVDGYFSDKSSEQRKIYLAWLEKQGEQKPTAEEVLIKAGLKLYKDGNQWCILAGNNIQEGICGFGDTIEDALYEFLKEVCERTHVQNPMSQDYDEAFDEFMSHIPEKAPQRR